MGWGATKEFQATIAPAYDVYIAQKMSKSGKIECKPTLIIWSEDKVEQIAASAAGRSTMDSEGLSRATEEDGDEVDSDAGPGDNEQPRLPNRDVSTQPNARSASSSSSTSTSSAQRRQGVRLSSYEQEQVAKKAANEALIASLIGPDGGAALLGVPSTAASKKKPTRTRQPKKKGEVQATRKSKRNR